MLGLDKIGDQTVRDLIQGLNLLLTEGNGDLQMALTRVGQTRIQITIEIHMPPWSPTP